MSDQNDIVSVYSFYQYKLIKILKHKKIENVWAALYHHRNAICNTIISFKSTLNLIFILINI